MRFKTTLIKKVGDIGILNTSDAHPIMLKEEHIEDENYLGIVCKPGQKAVAGDTVYCIKNTGGSCNQHDSFKVNRYNTYSDGIYPVDNHTLINGEKTKGEWSWDAKSFVVLVTVDSVSEFPCFRQANKNKQIVKFTSPTIGIVVNAGESHYPLQYSSNAWIDYNKTDVWTPCDDPKEIEKATPVVVDPFEAKPGDYVEWADESTPTSMTKGHLYKVLKVLSPTVLLIINNCNREDVWLKERFKRVPDKAIQDPVLISSDDHIDALAYALRIPISYISIDSMMNKPTQINQNSKGKQMNSNLFTDILKLLTQTEQTDLEKAPSTYAFFYNNEGEYEGTARVANEAEAKALLQRPEHLGYTMRIYSFSDEFTTQIPVVSIKKTVAVKPARKPRAAKA